MDKNGFFEEIYGGYYRKVYEFIYSRVRNPELAEDLTNDVFTAVYKNLHTYDASKSFISSWLYAIASNRLKNYYKSRKEKIYSTDYMIEMNMEQQSVSPDPMDQEELRIMLECLLQNLPERSRTIIQMKYYRDMTSREIGRNLNLSPGNVRVILKRTLDAMKNMLGQQG